MKSPEPVSSDRDEIVADTDPVEPEVKSTRRQHGDELEDQLEKPSNDK